MQKFTQSQLEKLKSMNPDTLQQKYNQLSPEAKTKFKTLAGNSNPQKPYVYKNTIDPATQTTEGVPGYKEGQMVIYGVNTRTKDNLNTQNLNQDTTQQVPIEERVRGLHHVRDKDELNGKLDFTYDNFVNIKTKLKMGEKLNFSEEKFLTTLENEVEEGKDKYEIFGLERPQDKELRYQNLALENRNIRATELRDKLANRGLNYNEVEKVMGYHQKYDDLLLAEENEKQQDLQRFNSFSEVMNSQFEEFKKSARERAEERLNDLHTGMSFSGFGRSSFTKKRREEIQSSLVAEINKQQLVVQSRIAEYMAELQGAEPETLSKLRERTQAYTLQLKQQQTENAKLAAALSDEANARFEQALKNTIALTGVNPKEVDVKVSEALGFAADKYGKPIFTDEEGNPIPIRSALEADRKFMYEAQKDQRDFEYGAYKDDRKFTQDDRDFVYGIEKDNRDFEYKTNKDALDYELKQAENEGKISKSFIDGNQKLFDDIRTDTKSFSELHRQYRNMETVWNNFQNGDRSDRASVEQALIMTFNKMLDPGSVVREGEFDRSAQGQALISTAEGFIKRLNEGGAGITDKTLSDMVNVANQMYDAGKETMISKKDNLKANASYLGADPSFVDNYFSRELGLYEDTDEQSLDSIWDEQKKGDWSKKLQKALREKHEKNKSTFNQADQTAKTKAAKPVDETNFVQALAGTRKKGQCGAFVNDYTQKLIGKRIMGDSYESKKKHINSKYPQPGGLAVWNPGGVVKEYGHTGIVQGIRGNKVIIRDANYSGDEKVKTHEVPIERINKNGGFVHFT